MKYLLPQPPSQKRLTFLHQPSRTRAGSNKSQWRNSKYQTDRMIARYPVSDRNVLVIGICNFDIVCHLIIGIWDFNALSLKANRFYLNQLELTLTDPWQGILIYFWNLTLWASYLHDDCMTKRVRQNRLCIAIDRRFECSVFRGSVFRMDQ